MPIKQIKNSFNAGELSEYMAGRTDINKYHNGCSKLVNATVLPHGGIVKRSGTEYIGQSPNKCKLFPFEFSVDDALVLEFSNLLIRFYKDGDRVYETAKTITGITKADPAVVTIVSHGYSTGDWVFLSVTGMSEADEKIYEITKLTNDTFSLQDTFGNDIDSTAFGTFTSGTASKVYQIVSPYTSEEAFEIHVTQSADVMYIAHEDHPPQKLSRNGDTDWTIEDVPFVGGPFLTENLTDTYLLGFARTGGTARDGYYFPPGATGTLTATGGHAPFLGTANDVGTLWQLNHTRPDNSDSKAGTGNWTQSGAANPSAEIRVKGDFNLDAANFDDNMTVLVERKSGAGEWQEYRTFTAAVAYSATETEDDTFYRVTVTGAKAASEVSFSAKNQINNGIVVVTSAVSTTVANVTVIDQVLSDNATDSAVTTSMWAEGAWGEFRGYPRTVTFFEDRLWWASSTNNPDTLWSSKSSQYEDMSFTAEGLDDEAITFPINDNEVSQVQWMQARQVMAVGAANKEYRFGASDPDKPVTPSDRKSTPQTSFGSNEIQPVILNNAIFFFQRQGRKLRAMQFDAISENFQADDATLLSNTILESAPTCMAVQRVPDSIIWITRSDGTLLSFTYEPDEEVSGWSRHITGAMTANIIGGTVQPTEAFESVAVIHGSIEDEVWVSVKRVVNGNTVRYIEKFSTRIFDQLDEANMLDSALTEVSGSISGELILASDTVRYGSGVYGSSLYGGTT